MFFKLQKSYLFLFILIFCFSSKLHSMIPISQNEETEYEKNFINENSKEFQELTVQLCIIYFIASSNAIYFKELKLHKSLFCLIRNLRSLRSLSDIHSVEYESELIDSCNKNIEELLKIFAEELNYELQNSNTVKNSLEQLFKEWAEKGYKPKLINIEDAFMKNLVDEFGTLVYEKRPPSPSGWSAGYCSKSLNEIYNLFCELLKDKNSFEVIYNELFKLTIEN